MSTESWTIESVAKALEEVLKTSATTTALNKFCKDKNFRQLGQGGYRTAFLVEGTDKNFVIKVAHNASWGSEANKNELRLFNETNSVALATIFEYDRSKRYTSPLWLIVEFIPKLFQDVSERNLLEAMVHPQFARVKAPAEIPNNYVELVNFLKKNRVCDLHCGNLGYRADGTVVILDYAQ